MTQLLEEKLKTTGDPAVALQRLVGRCWNAWCDGILECKRPTHPKANVRCQKCGSVMYRSNWLRLHSPNAGTQRPGSPDGSPATETRKPGSLK